MAILLLAVSLASVSHRTHSDHQAGDHVCAACLIAHGGLDADGATGAPIVSLSCTIDLPPLVECQEVSVSELRLASDRGPPA
jgi:hypothetical protein